MKSYFIHILVWVIVFSASVKAQTLIHDFSHITNDDGLIGNTINCISQDAFGYIWIGTNSGMSRYDGYSFKNWKSFSSKIINTVIVNAIIVDDENNLWIATYGNGLWKYNQSTASFHIIGENNPIASKNLFSLCLGNDKNIYVGSDLGFEKVSNIYSDTPKWEKITKIEDSFDREIMIRSLFADADTIWLGTFNESIIRYTTTTDTFKIYNGKDGNACNSDVMSIVRDKKGNLWAGCWGNGLLIYNSARDKWENYEKEIDLSDYIDSKIITDMLPASDGNLYVSTWGKGMKIIDGNDMSIKSWTHSVKHTSGLNNNRLRCLFEDFQGNVWIGTDWEGGLNIYSKSHKNLFHYSLPFIDKIDKVLARDFNFSSNGDFYITGNFGVFGVSKDFQSFKQFLSPRLLGLNVVSSCLYEEENILFIGTEAQGVFILDLNNDKLHKINDLANDGTLLAVQKIEFDKQSKTIWIATKNRGLFTYDLLEKNVKLISRNYIINDLNINKQGEVWIATKQHGVLRFNSTNFSFESVQSRLHTINNVKKVLIADNNDVYSFAPAIGFLKYSSQKGIIVSCGIDKCPIKNVENILEDRQGNIWISSETELYKVQFTDSNVQFIKTIKRLKHGVFTPNAASIDNDGRFFLGSSFGFYCFSPDSIQCFENKKNVTMTAITVNDKNIAQEYQKVAEEIEHLALKYFENSFSFEFSSMNHINAENTYYYYMLQGFDDQLRATLKNSHKATYTNIPPGDYVFKVKASGNESNAFKTIAISISSPIWRKWWAYAAYAISVVFLLYFFIKKRERSLKRTNDQLQKEVENRTEEISKQNEELAKKNAELEKQSKLLEEVIKSKKEKQEEIQLQQEFLQEQNFSIELQHRSILENIDYAKSIQDAVMQPFSKLKEIFPQSFLLYSPRNVVSGDFYWIYETQQYKVLIVADCTGHGVPGAFMSILGMTLINELVPVVLGRSAAKILDFINLELQKALSRTNGNIQSNDGMDLAMIVFDKTTNKLNFSGANNPLYLVRKGELHYFKPTKIPIGKHVIIDNFKDYYIDIEKDDSIYLFSDGYYDQFGGPNNKKFKIAPFKDLIIKISSFEESEKYTVLKTTINQWINTLPDHIEKVQTDDIVIVGVRF